MARETLRIGDRVVPVDDTGQAVVLGFPAPGKVLVRTDDGFELVKPVVGLVRVDPDRVARLRGISEHQAGMVVANDLLSERRRQRSAIRPGKTPPKSPDNGVAEVDLHLHEIIEDETRLDDGEKLEYQLRYFERALEAAIRDGKRKLIVIHGVGEGVLREEVRRVLQFYDGVRFHDADMRKYGSGATEVEILRR
jgi:hypothetical protein